MAQIVFTSPAGMVAMGMGYNGSVHGFPGVYIKSALRAKKPFVSKLNKVQTLEFKFIVISGCTINFINIENTFCSVKLQLPKSPPDFLLPLFVSRASRKIHHTPTLTIKPIECQLPNS